MQGEKDTLQNQIKGADRGLFCILLVWYGCDLCMLLWLFLYSTFSVVVHDTTIVLERTV